MRGEIIWDKAASASPSTAWEAGKVHQNPTLRDVHEYILVFQKEIINEIDIRKRKKKRKTLLTRAIYGMDKVCLDNES